MGGGVERGEDLRAAAARELREETGRVLAPSAFVGPLFRREAVFSFDGDVIDSVEYFFAVECERFDPAPSGWTDLERRTLQAEPNVVADLEPLLDQAAKIVGVSADAAHLEACEAETAAALTGRADVHRSQAYYLDVTPPGSGKAAFVDAMSRHLGLDHARIATLGDAANDVPMFARSGFSVAMGNAAPAVQAAARAVTATNDADGFAKAIDEFILRR